MTDTFTRADLDAAVAAERDVWASAVLGMLSERQAFSVMIRAAEIREAKEKTPPTEADGATEEGK